MDESIQRKIGMFLKFKVGCTRETSRTNKKAAVNSNRGIVIRFNGATRDLAHIRLTLFSP